MPTRSIIKNSGSLNLKRHMWTLQTAILYLYKRRFTLHYKTVNGIFLITKMLSGYVRHSLLYRQVYNPVGLGLYPFNDVQIKGFQHNPEMSLKGLLKVKPLLV